MFLNNIKDFFIKRILKNSFQIVKNNNNLNTIKSVGLVLDERYFDMKTDLIKELLNFGIEDKNLKVIAFNDRMSKNGVSTYSFFNYKNISWKGQFKSTEINSFMDEKFDLLISFYKIDKPILLMITNNSKANFKVGFSSIDKKYNNLLISCKLVDYKIFVFEMFKYLKILNKI